MNAPEYVGRHRSTAFPDTATRWYGPYRGKHRREVTS